MQVKVIYTQSSDNCVDVIHTNFKGDVRKLAKLLSEAYEAAGAEVLAVNKVEEAEVSLA